MDRFTLKEMAREQIRGNIGILFVCFLIVYAITGAVSVIPGVGSVAAIAVAAPFEIGLIRIMFNLRDGINPDIRELFNHFDCTAQAILLNILVALFTALWSLLFFIPGVIAALSYSMAPYILAENKNLTAMQALQASKQMMDGHKADLFILYLSFFGWALLTAVTFGIAGIYVYPYVEATTVNFYDRIKGYTHINSEVYDA